MEVLSRRPQPVPWRCRQVYCEFARHLLGRQGFASDVRDEISPLLLGATGLPFVVEDGGGEGAGEGEEDGPVAGRKPEARETWCNESID